MKTMRRELATQIFFIEIKTDVVQRKVDPFLYNCPVLVEFLYTSDKTVILVVELLGSSITAYGYLVQFYHSYSAENHQSCYQKLFILTSTC